MPTTLEKSPAETTVSAGRATSQAMLALYPTHFLVISLTIGPTLVRPIPAVQHPTSLPHSQQTKCTAIQLALLALIPAAIRTAIKTTHTSTTLPA